MAPVFIPKGGRSGDTSPDPVVLLTDQKYPKVAGAFRCAPDPWRLLKRRRAILSAGFVGADAHIGPYA